MIMRASEFIFNEGKASRRKQASMNAKRRMANAQPTVAPAVQPTASTGTSAPAVAPVVNTPPTVAQPTQPAATGTDWNALNQATAPAPAPVAAQPSAGSSMMSALKQKAMSAGKGIANKFSKQGKISARTDQIFMDKFLKDMATAEQTSTGLRGEPFDVKTWVDKYLAQNKWSAGEQLGPLNKAVAANYKPGIAKAMAAIGKYNNLGSTIKANAADAVSAGAMGQMANTLANPGGAGTSSTVHTAKPNNPNQKYATQPTAAPTTPAPQQTPVATTQPTTQPAPQTSANPFGQMTSQLTKPTATTQPAQQATAQPIKVGGQTLDPNNPADAKMIAMLQKQGKI